MKYCSVVIFGLILFFVACSRPPSNTVSQAAPAATASSHTAENIVRVFDGKINNKFVIRMTLRRTGKELSGEYHYANHGINLSLRGLVDDSNNLVLNEFDGQGNQTGVFKGRFVSDAEMSGTWSKPNGDKAQPFSLKEVSTAAANATPAESPDEISEHDDAEPNPGVDLNSEAKQQMNRLWFTTVKDCGGDRFMTRNRNGFVKELRSVTFRPDPQQITEADRLNNVQWKGTVTVKWAAERNNGTGDWKTAYQRAFMYFEKRNGTWSKPNMMLWDHQQAPCS